MDPELNLVDDCIWENRPVGENCFIIIIVLRFMLKTPPSKFEANQMLMLELMHFFIYLYFDNVHYLYPNCIRAIQANLSISPEYIVLMCFE